MTILWGQFALFVNLFPLSMICPLSFQPNHTSPWWHSYHCGSFLSVAWFSEIIRDGQVQRGVSISLWAVNVTVSPTTTFDSSGARWEERHMAHWFLEDTHSHAHTQSQFLSCGHASLHTKIPTLPHKQPCQHTGHIIVFWSKRTSLYVCMFSAVQSMWHPHPPKKFNIWKPDDLKLRSHRLISMIGSFTPVKTVPVYSADYTHAICCYISTSSLCGGLNLLPLQSRLHCSDSF